MRFNNNKELKVGDKVKVKKPDRNMLDMYEKYNFQKIPDSFLERYKIATIVKELNPIIDCLEKPIKQFKIESMGLNDTVYEFEIERYYS